MRVYLIGLGFGLIAVYFIFSARGCEWTPQNRVLQSIQECDILISDFKACQMQCYGISKHDVFNVLQKGDVDFSESQTSGDVKDYVLKTDSLTLTLKLNTKDTLVEVDHFHGYKKECACGEADANKFSVLYEPDELVLQKLVDNGFEVTRDSKCLFDCFGVDSIYVRGVLNDGKVLHDWSFPHAKPNPVYWIQKIRGRADTLLFQVELGSKTRVLDMRVKNVDATCDCP